MKELQPVLPIQTVLIVDDSPGGRELSEAALAHLGCDLLIAGSGSEALAIARVRKPDLILLDLQMPVASGFDVIRQLRNDPSTAGLCIVALTASAMEGDEATAMAAGFNGFISKPISLILFRTRVSGYLCPRVEATAASSGEGRHSRHSLRITQPNLTALTVTGAL